MPASFPRDSYTVGIICALDVEKAAVDGTLDEEHDKVAKAAGDDNVYSFGRIGAHNAVVACLPAGVMGKASATAVAKDMMRSFPIKAGFMVGICGGVWSEKHDVRLGDVVVSQPDGEHGGVVQWDYGKMERDGVFRRTGALNKPPRPLLNAVQSLKARHQRKETEVTRHLQEMLTNNPQMEEKYGYPGQEHDELFEAGCDHRGGDSCDGCDRARVVTRKPERKDDRPRIHYGNIASGDEVVKDAGTRDRIVRDEGVLCFEMEAAGLMDTFPCVVVRGVSDYADSHKNERWKAYAAATAACYTKELLGEVDAQGVEKLGLSIPFSMKGVPVTDHFVQREAEMKQLEMFFHGDPESARQKVFVVYGLGGMGKTQLCVEYVRRHKEDFTAIFWLDGSSKDALRQSLADAAGRLPSRAASPAAAVDQPAQSVLDVDERIDTLKQWLSLEANTDWLLVMDNVDREWQIVQKEVDGQAYDFKDFLPSVDHGNVLLTTRLARLQRPNASLHLREVEDDVGREMIKARAGRELPDVGVLLNRLGSLPLALVQAGAYIRQTNMSVESYVRHYDEQWDILMQYQDRYPLQEYAERSVLTTWKLSYEQVKAVKPEAALLLDQWAFLHPDDVCYDIIRPCAQALVEAEVLMGDVGGGATSELSFNDSLGVLGQYSLVSATEETARFAIHPVVHSWILHNITDAEVRQALCVSALHIVASNTPQQSGHSYMVGARQILLHARMAGSRYLRIKEKKGFEDELYEIASFMQDWESSTVVEGLYLRALGGFEEAWGAKYTATLSTVNNLGRFYKSRDQIEKAEEMYLRALRGYEETLGLQHTSTLIIVNNLGNVYRQQGKIKEAEKMYIRALQGKEEALGAKHTSTLVTVNNLGNVYYDQERMEEAEGLYLRALQGYEEAFGVKHTSTLETVNNLGVLYWKQGRMDEAEQMYLRALIGKEEAFGVKHTSTLETVDNLGVLYWKQKRMDEAEQMYLRALIGKEEALGAKHTSTLKTVNNLGNVYRDRGGMKEAEEMYMRALRGKEEAWGAKHTLTLKTVINLGILYWKQRRILEAEKMFVRAIEGYTDIEGNYEAIIEGLKILLSVLSTKNDPPSSIQDTAHQQRSSRSPEHQKVAGADSPTRRSGADKVLPKTSRRDRLLGFIKRR